jgi:hypothetical protein
MRYVYTADGNVAATIDSSGRVTLGTELGAVVGSVSKNEVFADEAGGERLGRVESDGRIFDVEHQFVGSVDANEHVRDAANRVIGKAEQAIDGAALILIVGRFNPNILEGPAPPPPSESTMMDEVMALAEENARPGIRKDFRPLTDADVSGTGLPPPPGKNQS